MRNFVIFAIIIGVFGAAGLGYFLWQSGQDLAFWNGENSQEVGTEVEGEDTDLNEINNILNDASGLAGLEEVLPGTEVSEQPAANNRIPVSASLRSVKLYENPFIRFSYPSYISFKSQTLNSVEIWNKEELAGTINIYSNPDELSLEDFSQKDNIIDYFTEGAAKGLVSEDFEIPTAKRVVRFSDYPELKKADIYLIEFNQLIVIAKDFSSDDVVGEYLLRSMEKTQ